MSCSSDMMREVNAKAAATAKDAVAIAFSRRRLLNMIQKKQSNVVYIAAATGVERGITGGTLYDVG